VAAYALGLVHHQLGSDMDALKWYDKATGLLGMAIAHWTAVNALKRVDACGRLKRWMDILSDCLSRSLTFSEADSPTGWWVPVLLAERKGAWVEQIELLKQDDELVGQINRFQVHPLEEGWSIRLGPGSQYGAREIPQEIRWALHASRGDHALIQWEGALGQRERDGMEELGRSGLARFLRDGEGRIHVVPLEPRIIGGGDARHSARVGRVPALLQPAALSDPAVPPREKPVHPCSAGPSDGKRADEEVKLYKTLLGLVGGSKGTADRLVEHERKQAPGASLSELIDRAITRILGDRRSTS
jgi:hypothetical protein